MLFEVRLRLRWFIGLGVCLVGLAMIARFGLWVWVNSVGIDFLAFVILRLYFRVVVRLCGFGVFIVRFVLGFSRVLV